MLILNQRKPSQDGPHIANLLNYCILFFFKVETIRYELHVIMLPSPFVNYHQPTVHNQLAIIISRYLSSYWSSCCSLQHTSSFRLKSSMFKRGSNLERCFFLLWPHSHSKSQEYRPILFIRSVIIPSRLWPPPVNWLWFSLKWAVKKHPWQVDRRICWNVYLRLWLVDDLERHKQGVVGQWQVLEGGGAYQEAPMWHQNMRTCGCSDMRDMRDMRILTLRIRDCYSCCCSCCSVTKKSTANTLSNG